MQKIVRNKYLKSKSDSLQKDESIVADYIASPSQYVYEFRLKINGKERTIVSYKKNDKGMALQRYHNEIDGYLRVLYESSASSFAYKEGFGVLDCLKKHCSSDVFLKADIHAFFDTVNPQILYQKVQCINKKHKYKIEKLLDCCFYNGRMPIGFVTSPVLSDIYLGGIDEVFDQKSPIIYTRYADDFIISATGDNAEESLTEICDSVTEMLEALGLELNRRKTYIRRLSQEGDAIHLLGLNLVKASADANRITVSDRYIREVCKEYCHYLAIKNSMDDNQRTKAFAAIYGKISFIKFASQQSTNKLKKMLQVKAGICTDLSFRSMESL